MQTETITYDTFNRDENGEIITATETLYFDINKLDILELNLKYGPGGVEGHVEKIKNAEDAQEAFNLFKTLMLDAYGKKSDDGKRFYKKDPLTGAPYKYELEASPALGELILAFIEDTARGVRWIEGLLPARILDEARKEEANKQPAQVSSGEPAVAPEKSVYEDYTREELLEMSSEEFFRILGGEDKIHRWPEGAVQLAYERKMKGLD